SQHGRLGALWLDWVGPELDEAERERLAGIASEALGAYQQVWDRMSSQPEGERTTEGYLLEHIHQLGWMESSAYRALTREVIEREVVAPLVARGIPVQLPPRT